MPRRRSCGSTWQCWAPPRRDRWSDARLPLRCPAAAASLLPVRGRMARDPKDDGGGGSAANRRQPARLIALLDIDRWLYRPLLTNLSIAAPLPSVATLLCRASFAASVSMSLKTGIVGMPNVGKVGHAVSLPWLMLSSSPRRYEESLSTHIPLYGGRGREPRGRVAIGPCH